MLHLCDIFYLDAPLHGNEVAWSSNGEQDCDNSLVTTGVHHVTEGGDGLEEQLRMPPL